MLPPNVIEVNTYTNKPSNDVVKMRDFVLEKLGYVVRGKLVHEMRDKQIIAIALRLGYK